MSKISSEGNEPKTTLEDDALIYQMLKEEDEQSTSQTFKNLSWKGKVQFFKDYYLKTVVAVVIFAILVGIVARDVWFRPQNILYVAVTDDKFDEQQIEKLQDAVQTYLAVNPKKYVVRIVTSYTTENAQSDQQLQTYLYAGSVDVIISPKKQFVYWAKGGYFYAPDNTPELSFYNDYPEDEKAYSNVKDGAAVRHEKEVDETQYNFGVSLKHSEKFKNLKGTSEDSYIGVVNSTKHMDEAVAFLQFMLDNNIHAGDVSPEFGN